MCFLGALQWWWQECTSLTRASVATRMAWACRRSTNLFLASLVDSPQMLEVYRGERAAFFFFASCIGGLRGASCLGCGYVWLLSGRCSNLELLFSARNRRDDLASGIAPGAAGWNRWLVCLSDDGGKAHAWRCALGELRGGGTVKRSVLIITIENIYNYWKLFLTYTVRCPCS